jgi:hypothetical protein
MQAFAVAFECCSSVLLDNDKFWGAGASIGLALERQMILAFVID